jgi:acetyl esterase/lipase
MGKAQSITIPLYEASAIIEDTVRYQDGIKMLSNIKTPTIEVFLPDNDTQEAIPAVLICPGGGYGFLAYDWEGTQIAQWLNSHGIAGIVLKYRLPKPEKKENSVERIRPMIDARQALQLIHAQTEEWNLDPELIGIMGFSAGGHLAAYASNADWVSYPSGLSQQEVDAIIKRSKFAFSILIYPVISMKDGITNDWTRNNLFGKAEVHYDLQDREQLIQIYSNENRVSELSPPTFLVHSNDDDAVPVKNSLLYYDQLLEYNVPAEMHLYPSGGHGYSLFSKGETEQSWGELCINWLNSLRNK